jgi:hypothetical protein
VLRLLRNMPCHNPVFIKQKRNSSPKLVQTNKKTVHKKWKTPYSCG